MTTTGVQRIVLEVRPGEPIKGSIIMSDDSHEDFSGWLELASKLELLRGRRDGGMRSPE